MRSQQIAQDIEDFLDEADTLEFEPLPAQWTLVGEDRLDDEDEATLVIEALSTVQTKEPWYVRLERELEG